MKKLSLQWRITLMTVFLIGATCVFMNVLIGYSGRHYMDSIRVADTGCGIPEKYRESIFQPFFRVDKSRSRENGGVGLGLSLVWEIVALHGGEIRVEESSEKGTTIAVKFPTDMKTKLL